MLADCLRSLFAELTRSQLTGEVWVVDNASTDDSVEMVRRNFPQVRLIAHPENIGFAAGNNLALRAMGFGDTDSPPTEPVEVGFDKLNRQNASLPQTILLLNPDTKIHAGALSVLVDFLHAHPQVGLVGGQLVYGDGSFQHAAFEFPGLWQLAIELLPLPQRLTETRLNGRYPREWYQRGEPFAIGHPLGAAMLVRREVIQQVGLLDEGYRLYVEEVDWCRRIAAAGWQIYCVPQAVITHFGGQSSGQIKVETFVELWRSRYRFYQRSYGGVKFRLARLIVTWGMRRKQQQAESAWQTGQINEDEYTKQRQAYQQVEQIWQGKLS